jgi:transcriptional regulator with XRE-family HTH domain
MSQPPETQPAEKPSKTLARQLKKVRQLAGLSQEGLAERIKELGGGLHATAITRIERGTRAASVDDVALLARALRVSPLYLMFPIDDSVTVQLAPADPAPPHVPFRVRMWARGDAPLLIDPAKQYGTVAQAPDFEFDRVYYTWAPGAEAHLEATSRAWSTCRALLAALGAAVVGGQGRLIHSSRQDRTDDFKRLKRLFRVAKEEIAEYIEDRENRTIVLKDGQEALLTSKTTMVYPDDYEQQEQETMDRLRAELAAVRKERGEEGASHG